MTAPNVHQTASFLESRTDGLAVRSPLTLLSRKISSADFRRDERVLPGVFFGMALFSEDTIREQLPSIPDWQRDGKAIVREFAFKGFPEAIEFVNRIAEAAEAAWHHPDIDIRWNKVRLLLTTHDQGGLTAKDFDLARAFDQMAMESGSGS